MKVRDYEPDDALPVAGIHAEMGMDYQMPDLECPLVVTRVVCIEDGKIIGATALKIEAETYLWISPSASPAAKWDAIRLMQQEVAKRAFVMGIEQLVAYVPKCIEKFFSKRLIRLGWNPSRDGWRAWSFEVKR